jgi:hypothetical protein
MAWLPFESDIAMNSEKLVLKYNPNWTGGGIKTKLSNSKQIIGIICKPYLTNLLSLIMLLFWILRLRNKGIIIHI